MAAKALIFKTLYFGIGEYPPFLTCGTGVSVPSIPNRSLRVNNKARNAEADLSPGSGQDAEKSQAVLPTAVLDMRCHLSKIYRQPDTGFLTGPRF